MIFAVKKGRKMNITIETNLPEWYIREMNRNNMWGVDVFFTADGKCRLSIYDQNMTIGDAMNQLQMAAEKISDEERRIIHTINLFHYVEERIKQK
jgi:hypothetical protein